MEGVERMDLTDFTYDEIAFCIGLLWSEISLTNEQNTLDRLKRESLYELWEAALDYGLSNG